MQGLASPVTSSSQGTGSMWFCFFLFLVGRLNLPSAPCSGASSVLVVVGVFCLGHMPIHTWSVSCHLYTPWPIISYLLACWLKGWKNVCIWFLQNIFHMNSPNKTGSFSSISLFIFYCFLRRGVMGNQTMSSSPKSRCAIYLVGSRTRSVRPLSCQPERDAALKFQARVKHTRTHTCSEQSLRILMWNASHVQKQSNYTWQEWVDEITREW